MLNVRILTNNLWTNPEGIQELFLHIEIETDDEVFQKAARLPPCDTDRIVANPEVVNDVALEMANRAIKARPQEKINEDKAREERLAQIILDTTIKNIELEQSKLLTAQEITKAEQAKLAVINAEAAKPKTP